MDSVACIGLLIIAVPIAAFVIGVIELRKLKEAVRELTRRVGHLEAANVKLSPAEDLRALEAVRREKTPVPEPGPGAAATATPIAPPPVVAPAPSSAPIIPPPLPIRTAAQEPEKSKPAESQPLPRPAPTPAPQPARSAIDWEAFLGVKLFAWVGGFVLFLGIVFLVKYSFDNNLITPVMRVALGTVIGIALIVIGWIAVTRNYRVSGQSLCATGILVLYGNIFAAQHFYHLIELLPAFASMVIVTAAAFFLAVRMNAQVIVILGLLGGFLTPILLSTGVDNPLGLFGYIAVLNIGVAAVALRQRWNYLILLAGVCTALTEVAWGIDFFKPVKANIAFIVFLGFEILFLAIYLMRRRTDPADHWTGRAVMLIGFTALAWAFYLLSFPEFVSRPGFLFSFAFIAEAGLLVLALLRTRETPLLAPVAGLVVFIFLASWTADHLTNQMLWWGLGGYIVFAVLHAAFVFWPGSELSVSKGFAWQSYMPLLPLLLICGCVGRNETSTAIWISLLILDVIVIGVAFVRRSLPVIAIALVITIFAAGLWIAVAPPDIDLVSFLFVAAGSGTFFFSAALFAARRIFPDSENVRRNIPALAASLPFLLLLMAMVKLPITTPAPFFITAFFLSVLLLALGIMSRTSWIALIALLLSWAVEATWIGPRINPTDFTLGSVPSGPLILGWEIAFFLLFFGYPFFTSEGRKTLPWALGALSGVLHFPLVYTIVGWVFPNVSDGWFPAAFIIPYLFGTFFLVKKREATPESGDARLAWQAGAALLFVSLIFPIQFEREWITVGWALEGFALLCLFRIVPHVGLRYVGAALLTIAFVRLALNPAVLEYHRRSATPIWNWYLYGYGLPIVLLFWGATLCRGEKRSWFEKSAPPLLNSLGAILTFLLLNIEIADYFSVGPTLTFSFSGNFARDMTYSIAWALFAFVLLLVGMKQATRWVRYAGVALLLVTLCKLFFHDLSNLSQLYRIGAFIGVAIVLIVVSFVYQRFLAPKVEPGPSGVTRKPPVAHTKDTKG